MSTKDKLPIKWRIHTPQMLKECLENTPGAGIFRQPFILFKSVLAEVADRCIEIGDPVLDSLMCRLALYEESDPYSPHYNKEYTELVISEGIAEQQRIKKQKSTSNAKKR